MPAVLASPAVAGIDLETDDLRPINQLCRARFGKPVSPSTIWRWTKKGIKAGGRVVRLEAVFHAGCWLTTSEALARFMSAQTAAALSREAPDRTATTDRALQAAGLL